MASEFVGRVLVDFLRERVGRARGKETLENPLAIYIHTVVSWETRIHPANSHMYRIYIYITVCIFDTRQRQETDRDGGFWMQYVFSTCVPVDLKR